LAIRAATRPSSTPKVTASAECATCQYSQEFRAETKAPMSSRWAADSGEGPHQPLTVVQQAARRCQETAGQGKVMSHQGKVMSHNVRPGTGVPSIYLRGPDRPAALSARGTAQ
jgi:hypothetical protein